ncbi:DUF1850 domain-containing protein [Geoglobus sp.]
MNKRPYFLFFGVCIALIYLLIRPVTVIVISFNSNQVVVPLSTTLTVSIEYTHSVSLTDVEDIYDVNDSGIYIREERWQDFLAGQPLEGRIEGRYLVKEMNDYLGKEWEYWFIDVNSFRVYVNGRLALVQPAEDGFLTLRVERVPAIMTIAR